MMKILIVFVLLLAMPRGILSAENTVGSETLFLAVETTGSKTTELATPMMEQDGPVVKYLMKRMRVPHCKRGPQRCEICRTQNVEKWCLLDVDPPDQDKVQRPVLEFVCQGERLIRVFDVLKSFAS